MNSRYKSHNFILTEQGDTSQRGEKKSSRTGGKQSHTMKIYIFTAYNTD